MANRAIDEAGALQKELKRQASPDGRGTRSGAAWAHVVDRRLATFLDTVYIPTTRVLRAGARMELAFSEKERDRVAADMAAADGEVDDVRCGAPTYRARYNLACYLASKAVHLRKVAPEDELKLLSESYTQLEATIFAAPRTDHARLATWARLDPSLAALRAGRTTRDKTNDLLALFAKMTKPDSNPRLAELEGLDEQTAARLTGLGVVTVADAAKHGWARLREELSPRAGGAIELALLGPLSLADVNALHRVGVRGVGDLASSEPADLAARLSNFNPAGLTGWKAPDLAAIDHWVMAARRANAARG